MRHRLFIILSCLFVSVTMLAQHKITGVVLDSEGEPAIGASVLEKGTVGNGAVTDIDGKFTLNLSRSNSTIIVSYVGYDKQEIAVRGRHTVDVTLKTSTMDEVVIVGFATQKRINATGAVKTIGDEMTKDRPTVNAVQSLQGAIAGLNITNDVLLQPPSMVRVLLSV